MTVAVRGNCLQFYCAVDNAFGTENLLYFKGDVVHAGAVSNHHMDSKRRLGSADRPDVQENQR